MRAKRSWGGERTGCCNDTLDGVVFAQSFIAGEPSSEVRILPCRPELAIGCSHRSRANLASLPAVAAGLRLAVERARRRRLSGLQGRDRRWSAGPGRDAHHPRPGHGAGARPPRREGPDPAGRLYWYKLDPGGREVPGMESRRVTVVELGKKRYAQLWIDGDNTEELASMQSLVQNMDLQPASLALQR